MDTRITRKQRRILITVFTIMLILLSSCDPVSYPTLPEQQMDTSSESTAMPESKDSIYVAFKPVLGAVRYGYTLVEASEEAAIADTAIDWNTTVKYDKATGFAYLVVKGTTVGYTYNISVFAENKDKAVSPITTLENYTVSAVDISTEEPSAYIASISDNSVEIAFENEVSAGNMDYKVIYTDADGVKQEKYFDTVPFTIENFVSGDITIYQKYKAQEEFGSSAVARTLTVKAETIPTKLSLTFSGSSFNVSDIPEDTDTINILKVEGNNETVVLSGNNSGTIETEAFNYGVFKASAIDSEGNTIAVSNPIKAVFQIKNIETTPRQQSIVLSFPIAEGINLEDTVVRTNINGAKATITQEDNTAYITITGLTSRQSYEGYASFKILGETITIPLDFKTTSFAGTYEWKPSNPKTGNQYASNFTVIVEDNNNERSDYKYYIYVDQKLDKIPEGRYRIMPLIDFKVDSDIPTSQQTLIAYPTYILDSSSDNAIINELSYIKAYVWNNYKWNYALSNKFFSKMATPTDWRISSATQEKSSDIFKTEVLSVTSSGNAYTTTSFEFIEKDGSATVVFFNKITRGDNGPNDIVVTFGNNFLRKNPDAPTSGDAPYTFTLSYTGAAE